MASPQSIPELELISHPVCPYVHRAAALLTEKGVPFKLRFIDLEAKPRWFLAISPRGKVPVLRTEGVAIFESVVILEYLDEKFPPEMLPDEPIDRARLRMWVEMSNDLMAGHYKIATAATPADRASAVARTREALERFEPVVRGPWFDGEQLTLVDFAAGPALLRLQRLDAWLHLDIFRDLPNVTAWVDAVAQRPAFKDTLVRDFDERFHALVVDHHAAA
jgi:glutathione S-transferase